MTVQSEEVVPQIIVELSNVSDTDVLQVATAVVSTTVAFETKEIIDGGDAGNTNSYMGIVDGGDALGYNVDITTDGGYA